MTPRSRWGLALVGGLIHAAILAAVVGTVHGTSHLSSAATWLAVGGASLALGAEAVSQRRDDVGVQPALETVTGLLVLVLVVAASLGASASSLASAGAVALGAGIALRVAAVRALGVGFGTRPRRGDALVRHGLYAWFRHPSEVGLALLTGGLALMAGSPLAAAVWLVVIGVAVVRIRHEEAELERRHGEAYRSYRTKLELVFSRSSAKG